MQPLGWQNLACQPSGRIVKPEFTPMGGGDRQRARQRAETERDRETKRNRERQRETEKYIHIGTMRDRVR